MKIADMNDEPITLHLTRKQTELIRGLVFERFCEAASKEFARDGYLSELSFLIGALDFRLIYTGTSWSEEEIKIFAERANEVININRINSHVFDEDNSEDAGPDSAA